MRRFLLPAVMAMIATPVLAQSVPPALMVKVKNQSEPLQLSKIETEVRIVGYVAETVATMTFTNPYDRVLEGDLYFPLPEGATISGYALDIEGKLIDGVAVEKHKGREVFEKIVRQNVDPGLIEWTQGSNFKTRVFPIPARGSRTIRIKYVAELVGEPDDPAFHLPLNFSRPVNEFALRVEVVKRAVSPRVAQGGLPNFEFKQWRESYVAQTTLTDVTLTEDLLVAVPKVDGQQVLVEQTPRGDYYFAIHDLPDVPQQRQRAPAPRHVVLCWDASGSRAGKHEREIGLLQRYFAALWPQGGGTPTLDVDLVILRHAQGSAQRFTCVGGDFARLLDQLESIDYDGGTQLGALVPLDRAGTPDFYLLFSDGLSNFASERPNAMDAPMYVITADVQANHAFLKHLATSTGGRYFNLSRLTDDQAVGGIGQTAYSYLSAASVDAAASDLYPRMPEPLAGRFTLVGRLTGDEATVIARYGYPGQPSASRSYRVSRADAVEGSLLERLWAQKKLSELVLLPERHRDQILALGKQFGMVTPLTSLIVLESLEQYVEHEIAPPQSLPQMRDAYNRQIDTIEHQHRKQRSDKIAAVIAMWKDRLKWYDTKFKYPDGFRFKGQEQQEGSAGGLGGGAFGGRATPLGEADEQMDEDAEAPEAPAEDPLDDAFGAPHPDAGNAPTPRSANGERDFAGEDGAEAVDKNKADQGRPRAAGIAIKQWDPQTPYLKELKASGDAAAFAVYMKHRAEYGDSPAFYLDCADFFRARGDQQLALQVLSNIAELELENAQLLRVLAHRLTQLGYLDLAVLTFEQVLGLRPEEPQSYRDLALVLARRAGATRKSVMSDRTTDQMRRQLEQRIQDDYRRAIESLYQTVLGHWDDRFGEIEVIALTELNRVIPLARASGVTEFGVDQRLVRLLDCDVRIIMTWHADNTDIDLWVIEPSGEKAYYGNNRTTIGGLVSQDFTGGYGPEEYLVRRAMKGNYTIKANYYGSSETRLLGEVTVQVDVFTNYGRDAEQHQAITIRLKEAEDTVDIGKIEF